MDIRHFLRHFSFALFGLCLAIIAGGLVLLSQLDLKNAFSPGPNRDFLFYSPANGDAVKKLLPPFGVMIENELAARPFQKALSQAPIVYEAPTEGNITRFLAIFPYEKVPEKMGPVRSARSYFLDWMHEYKGVYVHVGGHFDVLRRLTREEIYNADQFVLEPYFWRENVGKTALEHTMVTGREKLYKLVRDKNWLWQAPDHIVSPPPTKKLEDLTIYQPAQTITIDFGFPTYRVDYTYDLTIERYLRAQAKKPHIDQADGKQISVETVIVQRVQAWSNGDIAGTISMKTISKGKATVFYKGRAIPATWKKDALSAPTRFFDTDGAELDMKNYPVWIEVLPTTNTFEYR